MIFIYTDGSARKNGKADSNGGFGVVVIETPPFAKIEQGKIIDVESRQCAPTSNNREEMKAIIWALEKYGKGRETPIVYSDSAYCVNTFTKWMWGWKNNQWKKSDNQTPENLDLVQLYDLLISKGYKIDLQHIRGHAGILWNEVADSLATGKMTLNEVIKKYGR